MALGLFDLLPVLFFGIAIFFVGNWLGSLWFQIGALCCMVAGLGKVSWKLILYKFHKDLHILNDYFYFTLLGGFLLMFIGCYLKRNEVSVQGVYLMMLNSPFSWFFVVGCVFLALLILIGIFMPRTNLKANWVEEVCNTLGQLCMLLGVVCVMYVSNYYHAGDVAKAIVDTAITDETCEEALGSQADGETSDQVEVYWEPGRLVFVPAGEIKTGLIFYSGAKVEYTAYAPLMKAFAEEGIFCVLLQLQDNLAILDVNAADGIQEEYPQVTDWYMAGHSLGGAMAANYVSKHADEFEGLILLAAYSVSDLSDTDLNVISIYGTDDGILNRDKYQEELKNLPADYSETIIDGGCHCFFADYGYQEGDGTPTIDINDQWRETAEAVARGID